MSGDIHEVLHKHYDTLNASYTETSERVQELQRTLGLHILPGLVDELQLDQGGQAYCLEWMEDSGSIFRTLRRHKFIRSFTLEALRDTLTWRLRVLRAFPPNPPSPYLYCLPRDIQDPFGRPIIVMSLAPFCKNTQDLRSTFLYNMELLRLHLVNLNETRRNGTHPILQYVALLDIGGMTFNNVQQTFELLSWFVQELLPRFPGMLAALFVLNYSWAHTGIWNLAKRLLPATALERVFFPSAAELIAYFSSSSLPKDLGGALPLLSAIENPLNSYVVSSLAPAPPQDFSDVVIPDHEDTPRAQTPQRVALSATSLLNPFYGYPVLYGSSPAPTLTHGRRRKRDLVRTLVRLWWSRWHQRVKISLFIIGLLLAFMLGRNRALPRRWRWRGPELRTLSTLSAVVR